MKKLFFFQSLLIYFSKTKNRCLNWLFIIELYSINLIFYLNHVSPVLQSKNKDRPLEKPANHIYIYIFKARGFPTVINIYVLAKKKRCHGF